MLGWFADLFRFAWGLIYWNARKTWFQLRRGRSPCPCQNPSDSGRAYETQCDACMNWRRPARFRRVCPLLVETDAGLRCSVDTPQVRPFWGRAFGYYGGAALGVYLAGALAVFAFLRTIGYPISIVHVTWPGLWYRVPQARGWFFLQRSNQAFAAGRTAEGLLYLANSYEFDPGNYVAGIALAKSLQAGQPARADEVFEKLLRDHPERRDATAWDWYRALLARGDFSKIVGLARDELLKDAAHAHVWMRALLFATAQAHDDETLRQLATNPAAAASIWRPLLATELQLRDGRTREAHAALEAEWADSNAPREIRAFMQVYRVEAMVRLHAPLTETLDMLYRTPGLLDDEARITLELDAAASAGETRLLQRDVEALLATRLDPPRVKILCAQLIRHPDTALFVRVYEQLEREALPLNTQTAGTWFSLLCAAGAVGDTVRLHELALRLRTAANSPFFALSAAEGFFRGETADRRITSILPFLPLPLEVTYALIERYPVPATNAAAPRGAAAKTP